MLADSMLYTFNCDECGAELFLDYNVVAEKSKKRIPLEVGSNEKHDCPAHVWTSAPFPCRSCGVELYVTDEEVSKSGKRIPLNTANDEPHKCVNRRFNIPCRNCGEKIYFDDTKLSKNGKKVPLDASDGNPHDCPQQKARKDMSFGRKTMFG